jgi:hypothetical protein
MCCQARRFPPVINHLYSTLLDLAEENFLRILEYIVDKYIKFIIVFGGSGGNIYVSLLDYKVGILGGIEREKSVLRQ